MVTSEEIEEVMRSWLSDRIKLEGVSQQEFGRRTGIPRSNITRALNGESYVTMLMLSRIAETVGPPVSKALADIAHRCFEAEAAEDARRRREAVNRSHVTKVERGGATAYVPEEEAQLVGKFIGESKARGRRARDGKEQPEPRPSAGPAPSKRT